MKELLQKDEICQFEILTLPFTVVGTFSQTYLEMQNTLKVLKARYC
jgi:hypothetical protein